MARNNRTSVLPAVADDPRWARIVSRDRTADGQLWYSVATSGVYCRPSCPSRRANPENVHLHDSLASAKATGCRPCKRCHPDGLPHKPLAASRSRSGGASEELSFAVGRTSLGALALAFGRKGIASILLGDDPAALLRSLQERFPKAKLIHADPDQAALVARVAAIVEAPGKVVDLPLDPRGTTFQQRVWRTLQQIPAGRTASYAEIARHIGAPQAVRAVAAACAANPLAVVIPCHRVLRSNGSLSGYAWGVERKRALLDREALAPGQPMQTQVGQVRGNP